MAAMTESCTVCKKPFEVQLRWQMQERDGGFAFYCSRGCQEAGKTQSGNTVTCDGCSKRFDVELVSQVVAVKGTRKYACGAACREQILAEAQGVRLIDAYVPPPVASIPRDVLVSPTSRLSPEAPDSVDSEQEPSSAPVTVKPVDRRARPAEDRIPRRIAVFNHKGGTGKTTTAVSLAAALAARGKRVLLVDTDAQGNVAASLGMKVEKSLYHVLVMGLAPTAVAVPVRTNLDVLASNETLAAAELYLAGRRERDRVLRDRLASTSQSYDVVILDCSPSLSLMNQNALVFADAILVPVACDYLSLVGVRQVLKTVKNVNQLLHHPVRIAGVIPTMYDARAKICQDSLATLREHFGPRCLTPIRATAKIKEAPAYAKTIFEWAEDSNAARDYDAVVDQLWRGVEPADAGLTGAGAGDEVESKGASLSKTRVAEALAG
jgi:chromosome partitioning protein